MAFCKKAKASHSVSWVHPLSSAMDSNIDKICLIIMKINKIGPVGFFGSSKTGWLQLKNEILINFEKSE
jgi:hypothetical protein